MNSSQFSGNKVGNNKNQPALILASSSPYRQELLARLKIPFLCQSPEIEETTLDGEDAVAAVMRLSEQKARKIAAFHPAAIIIGSDQVALLNDCILTKPGNHDKARQQLEQLSGQNVVFNTGLCVVNAKSGSIQTGYVPFAVKFRKLDAGEIEHYLSKETPYDCAGSFKSEGLGISLLEKMTGDDPTALIGLPLIRLSAMLRNEGIALP
ncbi:MAG: septum formation protein Maf [Gammaproteobacteria bacterium RIFCSPLOWO2_02_FULL_47_50]|nr:MAG: septum formation protein Maf [Gammaproteobacteria bacterium RIFCSPLOWO2_01_FULL_47_190]OGT71628.1 MAG: septum formation protein Maf [Gammaproteobacteria bacterium RIFCSPLOWO2_12_47_11]OGT80878.1 MAG: septum formation protein Maf [Gammaproteobacteria bacterium RIFCSPLOWO2_02_FULL_47_50]OGT83403.1 MAG: septum formation protein Maf [Gammaproteobacteria bacterium RIFCSPLOWO2_12_FULL_47_76]